MFYCQKKKELDSKKGPRPGSGLTSKSDKAARAVTRGISSTMQSSKKSDPSTMGQPPLRLLSRKNSKRKKKEFRIVGIAYLSFVGDPPDLDNGSRRNLLFLGINLFYLI